MSTDDLGWPDKDRPGVPLKLWLLAAGVQKSVPGRTINSFMSGWRLVATEEEARGSFLMAVEKEKPGFTINEMTCMQMPLRELVELAIGTALRTEADLRAAEAASFKAGVEAAAVEMDRRCKFYADRASEETTEEGEDRVKAFALVAKMAAKAIRSLPIPDASALDAALERARQEEREACAKLAEQVTKAPAQRNAKDVWRENIGADIAAAIRARTPKTGELTNG